MYEVVHKKGFSFMACQIMQMNLNTRISITSAIYLSKHCKYITYTMCEVCLISFVVVHVTLLVTLV